MKDTSTRTCRICGCKLKPKNQTQDLRRIKEEPHNEMDSSLLPNRSINNNQPSNCGSAETVDVPTNHIILSEAAREQDISKVYVANSHVKIGSDCKCSPQKLCRYCSIKQICMQACNSKEEKQFPFCWQNQMSKKISGKALDRGSTGHTSVVYPKIAAINTSKQYESMADQIPGKDHTTRSKLTSMFVSASGPNRHPPELLQERSRSGRDDTYSGKQDASRQRQDDRDHSDLDITHKLYFDRDMPGRSYQQTMPYFGDINGSNTNGNKSRTYKQTPPTKIQKKELHKQTVPQLNRLDETGVDDHLRVRLENMALKKTPREELQRMFGHRPCCCPITQAKYCIPTVKPMEPAHVWSPAPANCLFIPACEHN